MTNIQITDNFGLSEDVEIRDNSPLAKAKLTHLVSAGKEFFAEFDRPMDQADLKTFAFGVTATSPDLLSSSLPSLNITEGQSCGITIHISSDATLFKKDEFSPMIPIASNEAWLGVEMDVTTKTEASGSSPTVGVVIDVGSKMACTTYTLSKVQKLPLPLLRDACSEGFSNFSITTGAAEIRLQAPGTLNETGVSGSIKTTVTLSQPYTLNPLASANLPFNAVASIQPALTLQVAGSIEIFGDFLFRSHKKTDSVVEVGIYKKQGSTFTVAFTAGAGLGGDVGTSDVLGGLLNAVLPGVDVAKAGITGDRAKDLNKVIKDGMNRSLGVELNAKCSAAFSDEAAVVYEIQLDQGVPASTDNALELALQGDWTDLDSLSNAHRTRNIVAETMEKKNSISFNLFGVYSATSVTDYLQRSTILVDETGQLSMIDKLETSRIGATSSPYASDPDKLRKALMEDFVCTATYAVLSGKLNLQLTVVQSYLDYERNMSRGDLNQNVVLGYQLGLIPKGSLDAVLSATPSFAHASVSASVRYDMAALMAVFFSDPEALTARTQGELEQLGRDTMRAFLDPSDPTDAIRIEILKNPAAWAAMDESGNVNGFGSIVYLSHLGTTQLAAVSGDWVSIRWWANAISQVAPVLSATLNAVKAAPANPAQDPGFMKQKARLASVLGAVTRKTDAAFVHGWGEAVIFALSGNHGIAQMDLSWNSFHTHYGPK